VLLLTATPHSGDRRAFVSLCGIGAHGDDPVMIFRRTRRDVRIGVKRRVRLLRVRPTRQERRVHALLARFTRAVHDERGGDAALALSVLHKRALSSARSLERSVERRLAALVPGDTAATAQLTLPLDDPAGELLADDDVPAWSADVSLADAGRERRMLAALCGAAREASGHEAKIRALKRLLRRVDEPAIVFTEYRDTLLHLHDSLGRPAVLLHGGLGREERAAALADFSAGRCSTLLATDAGGEGLNLHHRCRLVINLELPWNPMRLEQRIGRVDRIGQRRTVHAIHLIARETGEPRILDRLTARMARAHADIAAPDPIGHDEERAVAALIITGASASGEEAPAAGPTMPAGCVFPCLAQEAIAEAARLTALRALPSGATGACDADAWLVRARHRTTRARLRGRILLILQAAYEDGYGRIAESTLVFVALRVSGAAWHLLRRSESLAAIERAVSPQIEVALSAWREEAARTSSAFTSARLRRERTMSARGRGTLVQVGQPGLFDRRADAARAEEAARRRTEDEEDQQRYDAIERAACLSYGVPRILLAIAP
jgi:superfamily II DNA or RNA helicase